MIDAVIIDDEKHVIESLALLLAEHCPDVAIIGTAEGLDDGVRLLTGKAPDLVFLDIEMPGGSGFDLLERFPARLFDVVFVTAHNHYAIKAFKFSAVDYLLKPVDGQELVQAVNRIRSERLAANNLERYRILGENLRPAGPTRLAIPTSQGLDFVAVKDILHVQAEGRYSTVFLSGGRRILVTKNLGEFCTLLREDPFLRVHHSHLINLDRVARYLRRDGGLIVLDDGSSVPLAQARRQDFLKRTRTK